MSKLEIAAKNGDIQEVTSLLGNEHTRVTRKAITLAIHNGHLKVAKKLVLMLPVAVCIISSLAMK